LFRVHQADLESIVANASFLWERLEQNRFVVTTESPSEQTTEHRLSRWCNNIAYEGKLATLQKRLQWDNLDLDTIRPLLGTVQLITGRPMPTWAETLRKFMQMATEPNHHVDLPPPTSPEAPLAFEDALLAATRVARRDLLTRLGSFQSPSSPLPPTVLSATAYLSLERDLLQRLVAIFSKTFEFEFSTFRPLGQTLLNLLVPGDEGSNSRTKYNQFVQGLLENGLVTFFQKYPILGRLLGTAVDFWVETTAEFVSD
jgi:hypothetical protein